MDGDVNDVEKRWHDRARTRTAMGYVALVVMVALAVFAVYATGERGNFVWAIAPSAVLFAGGVGAFVKTYLDWRAHRAWPIWQGAGWALLTLTLLSLAVPMAGIHG